MSSPNPGKTHLSTMSWFVTYAGTILLYIARIVLTLAPEHGYIQPDEFFQFTEPIAARAFSSRVYLPWEFTREKPLRCSFFPVVIGGSSFAFLRNILPDPPAYLLLVTPRLVMTILSFICDWSLYKTLKMLNEEEEVIIFSRFALASSYVALTYFTRTFTNTLETILISLLMTILCALIVKKKSNPILYDAIGCLIALGTFNRPTFVCFAAIPVFAAIFQGWPNITTFVKRSFGITRSSVFVAVIMVLWDTAFYTDLLVDFWNIPNDEMLSSIVITPANFIEYNSQTENLSNHGLHPRWLHLVNLFLITSVLAFACYFEVIQMLYSLVQRTPLLGTTFKQILLIQTTVSLLLLSFFPHQEPRFLLPLTVIICLLYGRQLQKKKFMLPWLLFNTLFFVVYAFVHQAGVTRSLFFFHDVVRQNESQNSTIIFTNMYLPPQHLLNLKYNSDVKIHDLSVSPFPSTLLDVLNQLDSQNQGPTFLVGPSCLTDEIQDVISKSRAGQLSLVKSLFPHFSGEEVMKEWKTLMATRNGLREAFSLNIWRIVRKYQADG